MGLDEQVDGSASSAVGSGLAPARRAGIADYIRIMRLDHATKHIFIVPGIVLAILLRGSGHEYSYIRIVIGLYCVLSVASANYVINEFLDRASDAHHPTKSVRASVMSRMNGAVIAGMWLLLALPPLAAAASASKSMLYATMLFVAQGVVYNVRPLRSKDAPYLDVISESINNPIRLVIGWSMIDPMTLPPGSVILAYWLGGAFLMATKRLSEYREIVASHGIELLTRYRKSFSGYNENTLTASCIVYAILSGMFLSIFFVKYRIEYIFTLPLIALLFGKYMAMAMSPDSTAQKPERLFSERGLVWLVLAITLTFGVFTVVNVPALVPLTEQYFIRLN